MNYHHILPSRKIGGAGLIALHTADYLRRRSRVTYVWIPGDGPALREANGLGLSPCKYDPSLVFSPSRVKSAIGNLSFYRGFRRRTPGIAHVHSPFVYRAILPALRLSGLRCVVHVQLEEDQGGLRWAFRQPPDLIITCSRSLVEYVRRTLPERHRERQRIEAVPNAVDTARFRPVEKRAAKERVGARADVPLALMLANLAPHKGQETTIRAVAALKRRGIHLLCWLAGAEREGCSYTARLQTLIGALGVQDRVCLLGHRSDTSELLQAADYFLLPSTCEGLPLSILEAQATKVPVLAAPTAGIPEVIADGETGFLIPAEDADGYADRLAGLLGDAELYHRVAEQAYRATTSDYNWDRYCGRMLDLYEALNGTRRTRDGAAGPGDCSARPARAAGSR